MFKNPWINIALFTTAKVAAIYFVKKALTKELNRMVENNPDLAQYIPK